LAMFAHHYEEKGRFSLSLALLWFGLIWQRCVIIAIALAGHWYFVESQPGNPYWVSVTWSFAVVAISLTPPIRDPDETPLVMLRGLEADFTYLGIVLARATGFRMVPTIVALVTIAAVEAAAISAIRGRRHIFYTPIAARTFR